MKVSPLWSPQMQKWMRDAERHGVPIGLHRDAKRRISNSREEGGGTVAVVTGVPTNVYVAEDGVTSYVAEDGSTFYIQES